MDLKGRKWQPFESSTPSGYVTYEDKTGEIHVPYGTDPLSKTIQAHELSHVRYTSKVWTGNTNKVLQHLTTLAKTSNAIVGYAEDMRITALAGRLNVKTLPAFDAEEDQEVIEKWVTSFVSAGVPRERVMQAVKFILNEHTSVLKLIGLSADTLQEQANAERYIVYCAGHLHKLLETGKDDDHEQSKKAQSKDKSESDKSDKSKSSDKSKAPKDSKKSEEDSDKKKSSKGNDESDEPEDDDTDSGDGDGDEGDDESDSDSDGGDTDGEADGDSDNESNASGSGDPSDGMEGKAGHINVNGLALPDIKAAMVMSVPAPVDTEKLIQTFQHTLDEANWYPVKNIERMPLVRRAAQSRRRGRKLSETGVVLGSAYDAVSPNERRPFTAKRKGGMGGLTVAIDCSGSMCISEAQIEKLLTAHPQGMVLTYASTHTGGGKAVVRIIASHGRLAHAKDFRDMSAGMNGCDGPVLEWLAKQPGERVWVCDGLITCARVGGETGVPYKAEARDAWLKAHHIVQFISLASYLRSLTKR